MLFLGLIIFTYILNPCNLAPSNQSCNTTVYYTTYLGESASPHLDLQDPHHRWIAILFLYSAIHRMSIALDKWRTRDRSAVHVQALFNLVTCTCLLMLYCSITYIMSLIATQMSLILRSNCVWCRVFILWRWPAVVWWLIGVSICGDRGRRHNLLWGPWSQPLERRLSQSHPRHQISSEHPQWTAAS